MDKYLLLKIFLIFVIVSGSGYLAYDIYNSYTLNQIYDYESCSKAKGSIIMESYPEQCRSADGQTFTRELTEEEKGKAQSPISVNGDAAEVFDIDADIRNWFTAEMSGWSVKYPPSPSCGNSISRSVCLNQARLATFGFLDWHYGTPEEEGMTICGETFEECINLLIQERFTDQDFTKINYRQDRIVNGIRGVEIEGIADHYGKGEKERIFYFERKDLYGYGLSEIYQFEFSPELDEVYEKILSTLEFTK